VAATIEQGGLISTTTKNRLLSQVNAAVRAGRAAIPAEYAVKVNQEAIGDASYAAIWFRTRGCAFDRRGECTMCNYGMAKDVEAETMIAAVRQGLSQVSPHPNLSLYVSPSGNFLDDWEVPPAARDGILRLVKDFHSRTFLCESRPEFISEERISALCTSLGDRQVVVEMGLESATPWVLKYCIHKTLEPERYVEATTQLRAHGVTSKANIMLGNAFLTPLESIVDAEASVRWALAHGTDTCSVFPTNVKRWTTTGWLFERGLFAPPSLWSLVEVLRRLGPDLAAKLSVSWYKARIGRADAAQGKSSRLRRVVESVVVAAPTTCPTCQESVVALLDSFRAEHHWETVQKLVALSCACKDEWRRSLSLGTQPLAERLRSGYEHLGRDLLGEDWWSNHGEGVIDEAELPS
jgi:archaeosine synthase beta-subunit